MTTWSTFLFSSSKNIFAKKKVRQKMLWRSLTKYIHAKRMKTWSTFLFEERRTIYEKRFKQIDMFINVSIPLTSLVNKSKQSFTQTTVVLDLLRMIWLCENRQQPTWIFGKKVAKDGVRACVCSIFFLLLNIDLISKLNNFKQLVNKATWLFFANLLCVVRE